MISVAAMAARLTGTIMEAYCVKPRPKKSAETIFTRLETISGRLAMSAINPAAMTKANVVPLLNPSASNIANHNRGQDWRRAIVGKQRCNSSTEQYYPRKQQAATSICPSGRTCSAAPLPKKPDSSSSRLIMITAMKAAVAFQTILQTTGISSMWITPVTNCQHGSDTCAPADTQASGLPDDHYQRQ